MVFLAKVRRKWRKNPVRLAFLNYLIFRRNNPGIEKSWSSKFCPFKNFQKLMRLNTLQKILSMSTIWRLKHRYLGFYIFHAHFFGTYFSYKKNWHKLWNTCCCVWDLVICKIQLQILLQDNIIIHIVTFFLQIMAMGPTIVLKRPV